MSTSIELGHEPLVRIVCMDDQGWTDGKPEIEPNLRVSIRGPYDDTWSSLQMSLPSSLDDRDTRAAFFAMLGHELQAVLQGCHSRAHSRATTGLPCVGDTNDDGSMWCTRVDHDTREVTWKPTGSY